MLSIVYKARANGTSQSAFSRTDFDWDSTEIVIIGSVGRTRTIEDGETALHNYARNCNCQMRSTTKYAAGALCELSWAMPMRSMQSCSEVLLGLPISHSSNGTLRATS